MRTTTALPLLETTLETGSEAEWIRGAAQALLPSRTSYCIDEDVQSRASLVITTFDGVPV